MPGQLTHFVSPMLHSLQDLEQQVTFLSATYRDAQARLQALVSNLTEGGGTESFQGEGSLAFSQAAQQYITASEDVADKLEQIASVTRTCLAEIDETTAIAEYEDLDEELLSQVLFHLQLDDLLQRGENALWDACDTVHGFLLDTLKGAEELLTSALGALDRLGRIVAQWGGEVFASVKRWNGTIEKIADLLGAGWTILTGLKDFAPPILADTIGTSLDIISGGDYSPRTIAADTAGGVIGIAASANVVGVIVQVVVAVIHVGGNLEALQMQEEAKTYAGTPMAAQFQQLQADFQITADRANLGRVFDDLGKYVVDEYVTQSICTTVPPNGACASFGNPQSDMTDALVDAGKVLVSVPQIVVNTIAANIDLQVEQLDPNATSDPAVNGLLNVVNGTAELVTTGR